MSWSTFRAELSASAWLITRGIIYLGAWTLAALALTFFVAGIIYLLTQDWVALNKSPTLWGFLS